METDPTSLLDVELPTPVRYVPFLTTFSLIASVAVHAAARREERAPDALELLEAGLATFFLTRVVAQEKVGSIVREPFVEPAEGADPDDPRGIAKQPAGTGLRHSAGELLTCTRCLGPWAAALLTLLRVLAPRHARPTTRIMALAGANSMLHAIHAAFCAMSNRDPSGGARSQTSQAEPNAARAATESSRHNGATHAIR